MSDSVFRLRSLNFNKTKNKLPIAQRNTASHLKREISFQDSATKGLKNVRSHTLIYSDARTRGHLSLK